MVGSTVCRLILRPLSVVERDGDATDGGVAAMTTLGVVQMNEFF